MTKSFKQRIISNPLLVILRILCGSFFVFSGGAKLLTLASFTATLSEFMFLPEMLIVPLTYSIPIIEIALGLLLLLVYQIKKVSFLLLLMTFGFTVIAYVKYQNGDVSDCGCFGELIERKNNWRMFVENTVLMIFLGIIQFKSK